MSYFRQAVDLHGGTENSEVNLFYFVYRLEQFVGAHDARTRDRKLHTRRAAPPSSRDILLRSVAHALLNASADENSNLHRVVANSPPSESPSRHLPEQVGRADTAVPSARIPCFIQSTSMERLQATVHRPSSPPPSLAPNGVRN